MLRLDTIHEQVHIHLTLRGNREYYAAVAHTLNLRREGVLPHSEIFSLVQNLS